MTPFFKALQRMHKDHINAVLGESTGTKSVKMVGSLNRVKIFCFKVIRWSVLKTNRTVDPVNILVPGTGFTFSKTWPPLCA